VQGVRRPRENLRLQTWVRNWKTVVAGVRRVERLQHSDVVEGLLQGVHASFFLEELRVVRKLRKDRPSNLRKDCIEELWLKFSSRCCKFARR
jgi:hypothetical protein